VEGALVPVLELVFELVHALAFVLALAFILELVVVLDLEKQIHVRIDPSRSREHGVLELKRPIKIVLGRD